MTRLARDADGTPLIGDGDGFVPLAAAHPEFDSVRDALPAAASGRLDAAGATADPRPWRHLSLARPLVTPGKLWGIGLNYAEHAADLDEERPTEPASFMKPETAATGPGGPIRLPPREQSDRVTAEAELGLVVGRVARNVDVDEVDDVVAGVVPVIDVTAEDVLERNPRFLTRAKSFDSFLVFGPWIQTRRLAALGDVTVRTVVNDRVRAENRASNMLFSPADLVVRHSEVMTLEPGDVISTGTPGAHPIEAGDVVRAEVEGVGTLRADVVR